MKKITLLILLVLAAFSKPALSQTVAVEAPAYNGYWSALLGPNGYESSVTSPTTTMAYNRSCYLITQAELTRMIATNSVITGFGFEFFRPHNIAVAGQFTLYLQNTSDVTYNKGLTWSSILTGMSTNYTGALNLPGSTSQATAAVSVNLSSSFTYTGGGIYVAFDWYTSAATATTYARYLASYDASSMGANANAPAAGPAPTTLTASASRPSMLFTAVNTATNEVGLVSMQAPGLISKLAGSQVISAIVQNNGINALSNVPVTLSVTGASSYNNTQSVSIAAGGTAMVHFNGLNPTVNGTNNMTITIPNDQYIPNNGLVWTQTVNCTDYGNNPPVAASTFSSNSWGFGQQVIICTPINSPVTCSISAVKYAPSQQPGGTYSVCGVLLDAGGSIVAMSNTLSLTAASFGSFASLKFIPSVELTANTQYYYGVAFLTPSVYGLGEVDVLATQNLNLYYYAPIAGGSIGSAENFLGYVGMEATLSYSATVLQASASQTMVCKNDGPNTVTLTASGPSSFTWTPGNYTTSIVVVTPTVAGANGNVNYNVTGTDAASGCKSNAVLITVSVSACTGLSSNTSNGYDLKLFPNPSVNGKATITGLSGTNAITVLNTLGQVVYSKQVSDETAEVDLSNKPVGNYLVKITSSTGETRTLKLINQN